MYNDGIFTMAFLASLIEAQLKKSFLDPNVDIVRNQYDRSLWIGFIVPSLSYCCAYRIPALLVELHSDGFAKRIANDLVLAYSVKNRP